MRCVVQRVVSASVAVDGAVVSRIGAGALCLVGVMDGDNDAVPPGFLPNYCR